MLKWYTALKVLLRSNGLKHFIGVAVLVALAVAVQLGAFERSPVGLHRVHFTYFIISFRTIGFWLLMGAAAAWFVFAMDKFGRS
jgi:hypothetical protein